MNNLQFRPNLGQLRAWELMFGEDALPAYLLDFGWFSLADQGFGLSLPAQLPWGPSCCPFKWAAKGRLRQLGQQNGEGEMTTGRNFTPIFNLLVLLPPFKVTGSKTDGLNGCQGSRGGKTKGSNEVS